MPVALDVVYVNYRSAALTFKSVASLLAAAASHAIAVDVVVVDNSCDADEVAQLRALPASVTVIAAEANAGFSVASNLGASQGGADRILFLNPDTRILPETLPAILDVLEDHGGRALVGPRQYMDEPCTWSISPVRGASLQADLVDQLYDRGWLGERSLRLLASRGRLFGSSGAVPVRSLSGAALGVGRSTFDAIGRWDEEYFLYTEDTDLCMRARRAGVPVLYLPGVPVVHRGEGSARSDPDQVRESQRASWERFKRTHYRAPIRWLCETALSCARRLPRRRDRWASASLLVADRMLEVPSPVAPGLRSVIELARSPLFDNCATAEAVPGTQPFPDDLYAWLPPGTYFVRTAFETAPNRWREHALYRLQKPATVPRAEGATP